MRTHEPEQHQPSVQASSLPLPAEESARLRRPRVTGAVMTSHSLTAAHFFGSRSVGELSAEVGKSQQG